MKNYDKFLIVIVLFAFTGKFSQAQLNYIPDSTHGIDAVSWDGGATEIEMVDINNDGNLDMLCIGDHGSPGVNTNQNGIMVWFGNGTATSWSVVKTGNFGYGGICVGDVNNDGNNDVGYAMHHNWASTDFGDQYMEVALGDGTGINWTPWDDGLGVNGQSWGMSGTDFGDIDNDGDLDFGAVSFGCCDGIHIHRNQNDGTWPVAYDTLGGNSQFRIKFGDIDNDGNMDFIVCHQTGTCFFGDGTGNFTIKDAGLYGPLPVGFWDAQLSDVDNDGTLELVARVANDLYIYKFSSGSQSWQLTSSNLPPDILGYIMKDLNVDGFVDIAGFQEGRFAVWRGDGGATWVLETVDSIKNLEKIWTCNAADMDHSGTPDIIMLAQYPVSIVNDKTSMCFFREATVPASLNIVSVYPKGHECFPNNGVRFIEWITAVPAGMKGKVKLEISEAGLAGPWTIIDSGLPDNGRYQWLVPSAISSANCHIRYTVTDSASQQSMTSITPQPFRIGCAGGVGVSNSYHSEISVNVYPNPFSTQARIVLNGLGIEGAEVRLHDVQGRLLMKFENEVNGIMTLDRKDLNSGIYLLGVHLRNSNTVYRKIVVR